MTMALLVEVYLNNIMYPRPTTVQSERVYLRPTRCLTRLLPPQVWRKSPPASIRIEPTYIGSPEKRATMELVKASVDEWIHQRHQDAHAQCLGARERVRAFLNYGWDLWSRLKSSLKIHWWKGIHWRKTQSEMESWKECHRRRKWSWPRNDNKGAGGSDATAVADHWSTKVDIVKGQERVIKLWSYPLRNSSAMGHFTKCKQASIYKRFPLQAIIKIIRPKCQWPLTSALIMNPTV